MGALLLRRAPPPAVYLAGGTSDWRDHVRKRWVGSVDVTLLDPFTDSDQRTLAAFTLDDLALVERATCVLAYHDYHVYGGLALECGYAAALDRMIVYVCKQPRLDSMIAGVSKGVFTELDPALDFIERKLELKPRLTRDEPVVELERVSSVGHPHGTEELGKDAMTGQVEDAEAQIPEECCHSANVIHSHAYAVGGAGEMKCCHRHEGSRAPRPMGWHNE